MEYTLDEKENLCFKSTKKRYNKMYVIFAKKILIIMNCRTFRNSYVKLICMFMLLKKLEILCSSETV